MKETIYNTQPLYAVYLIGGIAVMLKNIVSLESPGPLWNININEQFEQFT